DSYLRKGGDAKSQFTELINDIKNVVKRKRAEEALRESEERFSHFMDNLPAIAYIKDDKGRMWFVNRYMKEQTGIKDSIGQTVRDLLPPELARTIEEEDKKIREEGITVTTKTRADKQRFGQSFDTIKFPINLKGKTSWIGGIGIDISEQKKAESELKESEEKFRQIFKSTKDGMFIHYLDKNAKLGKFIEVNDVACKWTGYSREELLEMTPYDLDKEGIFSKNKNVGKTFRSKGRITFESSIVDKGGKSRFVEFSSHNFTLWGRKVILTVARDITKQSESEKKLMESEEKFRYIFQYANDAIYLYPIGKNGKPGKFIEVNDNASKMLGYTKEEFLKMSPSDVAAAGTVKKISVIVKEVIKKKQMTFEATHKTKEGENIPVELSAHIFKFKGKQVMLSLVRDISERKRREEELQKSSNLYRILFETTGTANLLFDDNGTILLFNTRMESISGYKKEDVEGKRKWLEFIPKPELAMMMDFNEIRKEDPSKVPVQYESRFISDDGRIRDIIL
ncbi:MAG: PAS domain-containing protein, partial [Candidatus Heimdallarchaeota archaeon]|nr:PAS domain-containing protein [Candidatus Heimdallarchaeota archaeon]